ncbi:MAG: hypothetical protein V7K14_30620 [Nostoc sp.]|uniref:hypothetical protein n=1 Tax=Nostoc sp. TaxID=1180 RepID=UPI002FF69257
MAEPTLVQIFGANATQDATTLTIHKADLTGLTPSSTNTAESLLAGIVVFCQTTLTSANQLLNTDQSITITDSNDNITTRSSVAYRRKTKIIAFDKLDTGTAFDPDDY